ncbi:MAG: TlpA family protein disulfide reductase [Dysgonamonadaceae bacterium]|jgi:thiol-disulfide isomerase/thioredoxin|nr:TlpA family protein disulfide reductase [Dysgonamonadaceae bacterium]
MKRISFIFMLMLGSIGAAFAQISIVSGTWERGKVETVKLYNIAESRLNEIASSKIDDQKRFTFAFNADKEGFYAVALSPATVQNRYVFYLKPGDQLNLKITADSYELTGENTAENKELCKWHDFVLPLEMKAVYFQKQNSTYVDFFPLLDEKLEALKTYPKASTPNKKFNAAFEDFKRNDLLSIAVNFIQTPRSAHPVGEDYSDYYRNINLPALTANTSLLNYPRGTSLVLDSYMTKKRADNETIGSYAKYQEMAEGLLVGANANLIANDTIRGEIAVMLAQSVKTLDNLDSFRQKFGKCIATESQQQRMKDLENTLRKNVAGEMAPDFTFPDVNGKEYTLSAFKGKVVYVDIWATWCGWCIKEFPELRKIEEEYKNRNEIVFIGVSVDDAKDHGKWKTFLSNNEMVGIQLFAGEKAEESLSKPYKISGIPRFILVGKDGRLVSGDAPRPSSEELRPLLEETLKAK